MLVLWTANPANRAGIAEVLSRPQCNKEHVPPASSLFNKAAARLKSQGTKYSLGDRPCWPEVWQDVVWQAEKHRGRLGTTQHWCWVSTRILRDGPRQAEQLTVAQRTQ